MAVADAVIEILGIIKKVTPALVEVCVSMAVLCSIHNFPSIKAAGKEDRKTALKKLRAGSKLI
ncbi:hypothetical protein [Desulfotignum balticum]|uniref:hypothetical protein n=1 Tax=Desulfotignum balticum TaxID=115781 RepID=UPI00046285CB|nr:hypothetical protein [Desulfotignum balticum]